MASDQRFQQVDATVVPRFADVATFMRTRRNTAYGGHATVAGGYNNSASGLNTVIGGGASNTTSAGGTTIAGGGSNTASAPGATIGGGGGHTVSGINATVPGGFLNTASGGHATVAGGLNNTASGDRSTVAGGGRNAALGDFSFAAGRRARALHDGAFVWGDGQNLFKTSSVPDEFNVYCSGGARFFTSSPATTGVLLAPGGGSWSAVSDRASKENVEPVDGRAILAQVVSMPLSTWNYKAQDDSIRHMGPMAQDFHAAFGLGVSDKLIDTIDPDGVALAAIQGLNALVQENEQRLAEKDAEIAENKAEIEQMKAQLSELTRRREEQSASR